MESPKPSSSSTPTPAPPPAPIPVFPTTVTATTPVAGTPLDITRVIQILYQDVEMQINRADLKAQITLSTAAILSALVVNVGLGITTRKVWDWSAMEWAAAAVYLLFLACLCATIIQALLLRFRPVNMDVLNNRANPSLYFSGHIITLDADDYAQRFEEQSNANVLSRLIKQVHAKSRVLELKLEHIRVGLRCLGVALLLWLLSRGMLLLAYGHLPA